MAKTVDEVAREILGKDATFDTALPQEWANKVKDMTGIYPPGHMVWYYPHVGPGKLMGIPIAVSDQGRLCLGLIAVSGGVI